MCHQAPKLGDDHSALFLPQVFNLMKDLGMKINKERLTTLANITLKERPELVICVSGSYIHTRVLRGVKISTSGSQTTITPTSTNLHHSSGAECSVCTERKKKGGCIKRDMGDTTALSLPDVQCQHVDGSTQNLTHNYNPPQCPPETDR